MMILHLVKVYNIDNRTAPQFNMLSVTQDVFVEKYEKLWLIWYRLVNLIN